MKDDESNQIKPIFLATVLIFFAAPGWSQSLPGFLEGPLTDLDVVNRTARINGVVMSIPEGTPIVSPTVDLNELAASQGVNPITLIGGAPLPGRSADGFTGGTCLCATEVDPLTGAVTATEMVLEPAENVLIATVTAHGCVTASCDPDDDPLNELRVGGTLMDPNTDPRLVSDPPTNRGFELDLTQGNLVGVPASAEGFFGADDRLHLYTLEIDGGALANAGIPEVSVVRAQCRQRDGTAEWGVLGATHDPNSGTTTIRRGDTGGFVGTAAVVADADDPTFGAYDFDATVGGTCADTVIVDFASVTITAPVDVRIDDPEPDEQEGGGAGTGPDTVTIDRTRFRAGRGELRVSGSVVPGSAAPPAVVDVYVPGSDDGAGGCNGVFFASTAVDPIEFDWDFRSSRGAFPINPQSVCAVSPNGGSAEESI